MTRTWAQRLAGRLAALGVDPGPASGQVVQLAVEPGLVTARVREDPRTAWTVRLGLPVFTDEEWARLHRAAASDTAALDQLLDGELPPDADALFARAGLPLLPAADGELVLECDCPDWALPCAHLSAALAALGAAFDDDPFLIPAWRGRDRRAVLDAARGRTPEVPAAAGGFWDVGELPVPRRGAPAAPAVAELGRPAITVRGRGLAETLAPAYEAFLTW